MPHIFISHASADDNIATHLCGQLNKARVDAWVDHVNGLGPQERWGEQIHHAIDDCACGLFLISPASVGSKYCEVEWTRLLALGKRLYLAVIEPVAVDDIPVRLRPLACHDLTHDIEAEMDALVRVIASSIVRAGA